MGDITAAGLAGKALFVGGSAFEDGYLLAWEETRPDGGHRLILEGRLSRASDAEAAARLEAHTRGRGDVLRASAVVTGAHHPAKRGSEPRLETALADGARLDYAPYEADYRWTKPQVADGDAWVYESKAYDPAQVPLCQQGIVRLTLDGWDGSPQRLARAIDTLGGAVGLDLSPSSEREMELAFLRQNLWAVKAAWKPPEGAALEAQIDSARQALATALGQESLTYDWRPQFRTSPTPEAATSAHELGRPTWRRLDIAPLLGDALSSFSVSHRLAISGGQASKILVRIIRNDGCLKSIEERKRTGLLAPFVRLDDEYSGGGDYVFCRLNEAPGLGDLVFDPSILERADHVAHGLNLWGQAGDAHEADRLAAKDYPDHFVYEVMFKHDLSLVDYLRAINVDTAEERDEILAAFAARGIREVRGQKVEDLVRIRPSDVVADERVVHELSKINTLADSPEVNRALDAVFDAKVTRRISRAEERRLGAQLDNVRERLWASYCATQAHKNQAVAEALETLHGIASDRPSRVEPLVDGREVFPAVKDMIRGATRSIQVAMSLLGEQEILDLLAERARAGVTVQLLLDPGEHAAPHKQAQLAALREAGAEVAMYPTERLPRVPETRSKYHPKYLVVDGDRCIIGGMTWNLYARDHIHDIDVKVTGAAVDELARGFARDWAVAHDAEAPARGPEASPPDTVDAPVDFLLESDEIQAKLLRDIREAKRSIHIEMFILEHPPVIRALREALDRGVEVKVLINRFQGFWEVANTAAVHELREHGADVRWFATEGEEMMHTKLALFDGERAELGSANWTAGGLEVNREANVALDDAETVASLEHTFAEHWENESVAIDVPDWLDGLAHAVMLRLREHPTLLKRVAQLLNPVARQVRSKN